MKKVIEVNYGGQSYKVKAKYDGNVMVVVKVYHLARPTWKIFRYDYVNWGVFSLKNYDTVVNGIIDTTTYLIKKEQELHDSYYKFKKFMEKY